MANENNRIPREWLDEEVTISREELGRLMAEEISAAVAAAKTVQGPEFAQFMKGFLEVFASSLGTEIFRKLDEEEPARWL